MLSKKGVFKKPNIIYRSYKRPTFFSGMASLFDLYNVKRHQVYFSYYDDFDVMAEDFKATGIDLQKSLDKFAFENDMEPIKRKLLENRY